MNSTLVSKQGFLAHLLMKVRGVERARLCEVVDGLAGPSNFSRVFSTIPRGLMGCLEDPLPVDSFANHAAAADGPEQSFEAHLPLKESLCFAVPMVSQTENWSNQPPGWFEPSDSWEGKCSK